MSYSVGAYFESFIKEQIATGRFNNASEIIREGLRMVEEREQKVQALRLEIQEAVRDLDEGQFYTPQQVMENIEQQLNIQN